MSITFTYDLEDSRTDRSRPPRFEHVTDVVLEFLAERAVRGTFFVVGELAESHPQMVQRVRDAGHELALHGYKHVPLTRLDARSFAEDLRRGRGSIEDAAGVAVEGYRAPIFSLTPGTAWGVQVLTDAGFTYSSSVLPAVNPLNGWPGAPRAPFAWSTGLLEIPVPVAGRGRVCVPFMGGIYLRYLPMPLVERCATAAGREAHALPWIYCHPYDFDPEEPFDILPEASWLTSRLLHLRRGGTFDRVERLLRECIPGAPLRERCRGFASRDDLPTLVAA
ncbi:polysaccharide deacetylase family protein [Paraconexibacter algicola]|uniref:Polysaccharide deacetylase family protein n=1 Tax=Paraconexibacter algicola TaxID=2133960 RepID=A0A2T4UKZ5_9ACTN|nr:polysaccharide deacetylase family protein [Paraconexibacter algicola]PTL59907.1 polysaccharide deacetylase family protein [Paraconexibacter algicola]